MREITLPGATDPEQVIDLFEPSGSAATTAVALVHGGGWYGGTRAVFHAWAQLFADHGHPVASLGYRIGPDTTYRDKMTDVAAGVAVLSELADGADRLVLMGSSAGAHLITCLALDGLAAWTTAPTLPLAGVISSNGPGSMLPVDLLQATELVEQLAMTPEEIGLLQAPVRADPLSWFFQLAEHETYFPHEHVADFADRLERAGHRTTSRVVPGTRHGYVYQVLDTPAGPACATELLAAVAEGWPPNT